MKVQSDEDGGRILLGNNIGGGAVMLRPIRFRCAGVSIQATLPCMYVQLTIRILNSDLPKKSTCTGPSGTYSNWSLSRGMSVVPNFNRDKTHTCRLKYANILFLILIVGQL